MNREDIGIDAFLALVVLLLITLPVTLAIRSRSAPRPVRLYLAGIPLSLGALVLLLVSHAEWLGFPWVLALPPAALAVAGVPMGIWIIRRRTGLVVAAGILGYFAFVLEGYVALVVIGLSTTHWLS